MKDHEVLPDGLLTGVRRSENFLYFILLFKNFRFWNQKYQSAKLLQKCGAKFETLKKGKEN